MNFASLADELADAYDQGDIRGGRSLADEFGLDLDFPGREDEDEINPDGSADTSPDLTCPTTPPDRLATPGFRPQSPSPSRFPSGSPSGSKRGPNVGYREVDEWEGREAGVEAEEGEIEEHDTLQIDLLSEMSPLRLRPSAAHGPTMTKDPLVELQDYLKCTSRFISVLRSTEEGSSELPTSSSRSISASRCVVREAPKASALVTAHRGDTIDLLTAYASALLQREKEMDGRMHELGTLICQWEEIRYGSLAGVDLRSVITTLDWLPVQEQMGTRKVHDGLPASTSKPLGLPSVWVDSPDDSPMDPVDDVDHAQGGASPFDADQANSQVSDFLPEIIGDGTPRHLANLSDTLHLHSSLSLSAQHQVRQIRGAMQGAQDRDAAEEVARKGVEAWEIQRVQDGLKGQSVADKVRVQMEGFLLEVQRYESLMEGVVQLARRTRRSQISTSISA